MILNMTQHDATPEQLAAGVIEPSSEIKDYIKEALTFRSLPDEYTIHKRAWRLAQIATKSEAESVMIGGAPYLMSALERELKGIGKHVMYAYSERVSEDHVQPDGSVKKVSAFKHIGFVRV